MARGEGRTTGGEDMGRCGQFLSVKSIYFILSISVMAEIKDLAT